MVKKVINKSKRKEKAHYAAVNKKWRMLNKDKIRANKRRHYWKQKENNILFRIKESVRGRIRRIIKTKYLHKDSKVHDYLGCTLEQFKIHLESQFQEGMTWDNYGKWHIDHIIPISSGNTLNEIYKLNHYTNFQPLWASDNIKKGAKILTPS